MDTGATIMAEAEAIRDMFYRVWVAGPYALWAMLAVAFVAFHTGTIVRHNILCVEPVLEEQGRYRLENRSLAILLSG